MFLLCLCLREAESGDAWSLLRGQDVREGQRLCAALVVGTGSRVSASASSAAAPVGRQAMATIVTLKSIMRMGPAKKWSGLKEQVTDTEPVVTTFEVYTDL